jgi:diketogulonate reductase-like aldo/keto reductase
VSIPNLPGIIYGTAWKKADTARLVSSAIQLGFRGIDTACQPKHYDEAGVGAGVAACLGATLTRADLYLQTKFTPLSGQDPARVPYDPEAALPVQVAQSCAASLENLRTRYLDCLVLHSPLANAQQTLEVWRAMESLVGAGTVLSLGISNCRAGQLAALCAAARIKPSIVQNRWVRETHYDRDIRAFCRQQGIIYQSFWTLTANPDILSDAAILALTAKYGRTAAQILFRYLTQCGIVPLSGTRSAAHMREDLAVFEFELSAEERAAVDDIF